MLLRLLFTIIVLSGTISILKAKELSRAAGLFGGINFNNHISSFSKLPGIPNCCPQFENADGKGIYAGMLFKIPISKFLFVDFRASYSQFNGEFISQEQTFLIYNSKLQQGIFEHRMDINISDAGLNLMLGTQPVKNLNILGGFRFGLITESQFSQYEIITKPDNKGVFVDSNGVSTGKRTRNELTGTIPEANDLNIQFIAGISYDIALNTDESLMAAPEFFYSRKLNNFIDSFDWKLNAFSGGLAIKYKLGHVASYLPPLFASIRFSAINADEEYNTIKVLKEENISTIPLLNSIYFEDYSFRIPERYERLENADTENYVNTVKQGDNLVEVYHKILNIIGKRMSVYQSSKITLSAAVLNSDTLLARKRAGSIKNYLVNTWNISPGRIDIEFKNINLSKLTMLKGTGGDEEEMLLEESNRVDIYSNSWPVIAPYVSIQENISYKTPKIQINPVVSDSSKISEWSLKLMNDDKLIKEFSGKDDFPGELYYDIASAGNFDINKSFTYAMELSRSKDEQYIFNGPVLLKNRIRIIKNENYYFIWKNYDEIGLSDFNLKIAKLLKATLMDVDTVHIDAYSGVLGFEETNKIRAEARINSITGFLNFPKTKQIEYHYSPIFDNSLPEGRVYNRLVKVNIQTRK